jgi:hypothetical protein
MDRFWFLSWIPQKGEDGALSHDPSVSE